MERTHDERNAYRARLLDALRTHKDREREEPGSLLVFANQEPVGTLDCDVPDSTLVFASGERPIRDLEIRTASGLLVGGFCAPELGVKRTRCRAGLFVVEIDVHNHEDRGSIRVSCRAAQPVWYRTGQLLGVLAAGVHARKLRPHLSLAAQVVLASAVVFLVADRLSGRFSVNSQGAHVVTDATSPKPAVSENAPPREIAPMNQAAQGPTKGQPAATAQAATFRTMLSEHKRALTEEFDHRLQAMQNSARLDRERLQSQITALAAAKVSLSQEVAALKTRDQPDVQASTRKLENRIRDVQNAAEVERARLQDEIKALATAKDAMGREILALKNREIEQGLKQQAVVLARILSPQEAERKTAEIAEVTVLPGPTAKTAEARAEGDASPFTFWVSFQDGTSEENIERLIRTIQGRKGPMNAGWYNVEVTLPKPQTPEAFFETLKREKIVKSVTLNRSAASGQ